ncbi:MAG TPA: NADH-quinone oxidoreductase subunit N [Mucilaginibacter sp.]|nr:NADH-quinone oxidoreductase subunit N [Mucilaginibacter sp.]
MNDLLPFLPGQLQQVFDGTVDFMPEIYLSALFVVVLVTDLLFGKNSAWICKTIVCGGLLFVISKDVEQYSHILLTGNHTFFSNMLVLHDKTFVFKVMIDTLSLVLLLYFDWDDSLASHKKGLSDLHSISIAGIFGMHLMVMAVNLLSIYLSVEMVSIASYLMVSYRAENSISSEAGLKYVLFGAASSAIMLYGISLLYGFGGSLSLFGGNLLPGLMQVNPIGVSLALILFLAGIGFKLSFVPMHFWVPDIYQGAPAPISAFLSTVTKIAAFSLLINFLTPFIFFPKFSSVFDFRLFISVVGIVTMIAGNFAATLQNNIKRMLAYSSIGHTGFALMALVNFNTDKQGITAITFYLLAYSLANLGAWMLASYFANTSQAEEISDLKGLGFKYPLAGVAFVVILISLTGIPVTAGFYGKFVVFSSVYTVYQADHNTWLLLLMITGAVTTVVSLFYYIKIPLNLFLRKTDRTVGFISTNPFLLVTIAIISLLIVGLGLFPDYLIK